MIEDKILTPFVNQEKETCPDCGNPINECTCEEEGLE